MKLVINTEALTDRPNGGFSYAEAVRMIAEAGFDANVTKRPHLPWKPALTASTAPFLI